VKLVVGGPSRRALGALLVLLAATAACGGESKADSGRAAEAEEPARAAAEGDATTPTTAGGKAGKKSSGDRGGTTTTTTATGQSEAAADGTAPDPKAAQPKTETRKIEVLAELKESCLKPGGSQTLTVRTLPSAGVAFDTEYSDYLTGMEAGHYGGNSAGYVGEDGTWTSTWVVAPNAPAGKATVLVLAAHSHDGMGETKAVFTVADALGKCS
jgi:hypothetical protein